MEEKCNKYETLFTFANDESFHEHINECDECQSEHLKMLKVSSLVKEVKPFYFKQEKRLNAAKLIATLLLMVFLSGFVTVQIYNEKYKLLY